MGTSKRHMIHVRTAMAMDTNQVVGAASCQPGVLPYLSGPFWCRMLLLHLPTGSGVSAILVSPALRGLQLTAFSAGSPTARTQSIAGVADPGAEWQLQGTTVRYQRPERARRGHVGRVNSCLKAHGIARAEEPVQFNQVGVSLAKSRAVRWS